MKVFPLYILRCELKVVGIAFRKLVFMKSILNGYAELT